MLKKIKHHVIETLPLYMLAILVGGLYAFTALSPTFTQPVGAATDNHTVAGGNPGSLPTVGAASVALPTLTMDDADGDDFSDVDGEEIFEVVINSADYPGVVFDQTVVFGDLTVAGTCGHTSATVLSFTDATTARVTVSGAGGAATCGNNETVTIAGLQIQTIHAQSAPGANELVTVDNAFTAAGSPVASSDTINLAITAADAAGSISLADATVGATQNTTLTLTIPVDLENNDTVTFTMPANIEVVGTAFSSTTFAGTGFSSCSETGQAITCTVDTDLTAGTGDIVMSGMSAIYEATAADEVTDLEVNDVSAAEDIATDATVDVTDTTAVTTLTQDIDASAVTEVGDATGQVTLDITFPVALATGDTIEITFPNNWDISAQPTGSINVGLDNTVTVGIAGQIATLTLEGAQSAGADTISFNANTLTPFYAATGQTISTLIEKSGGEDVVASAADTGVTEPIDDTTAADAAMSLTLVSGEVGGPTNGPLSVDVPVDMANTDYIEFDAPANIDVSAVAYVSDSFGGAGVFTCTNTAGQTVRCTTDGVINSGAAQITMSGFVPLYTASGQTITNGIVFDMSGSANTATDASGTVTDTTAADAQATVFVGFNSTVGDTGLTQLNVTLPFALDADDTIDITFPASFDVSGVGADVTGTLEDSSNITCAAAGQVVTCTTPGPTLAAGSIVMTGITTLYEDTTDVPSVEVEDEGVMANDIATDVTVATDDITPADAAATLTLASGIVGATQNTTLNFDIPVDMGAADTVVFTAPANLDVTNAAYSSDTFGGAGSFACAAAGQVVTCTANGAITAGVGDIVMAGITGAYEASTQTITTVVLDDTGNGNTATDASGTATDTVAATLTNTSINLSTTQKGANATATFGMTLVNDLPNNGIIEVTFPAGFNLATVSSIDSPTNIDGGFVLTDAGQVLTITRDGGGSTTAGGTSITLPMSLVINTITTGTTANFDYEIQNSATNVVDRDAAVSGVTITEIPAQPSVTTGGGGGGGGGGGSNYIPLNLPTSDSTDTDDADEDTDVTSDDEETEEEAETEVEQEEESQSQLPSLPSEEPEDSQEGEVKESAPEGFTDVTGHWGESYVNEVADMGYIDGKTESNYAPDEAVTGAEVVETANKAFGVDINLDTSGIVTRAQAIEALLEAVALGDIDQHFTDNYTSNPDYYYAALPDVDINASHAKYVAYAVDFGIIDGYADGTFGANNNLTRAEFAKIVLKLLDYIASHG